MKDRPLVLSEAKKLYVKAKKAYYNTDKAIMTDAEFDRLEERITELDPEWPELHKTGILGKKSDVEFEYLMPSLAKVKADDMDKLGKWMLRYAPAGGIVSSKIDGSSVQATYVKGKLVELATRGDGITGKSIMHLAYQLSIPKQISSKSEKLVIRQEAAIPRSVFAAKWSEEFETDRAAVSGLLNRQDGHKAHKDIRFVSLRIINSEEKLADQFTLLESLGLETPKWNVWRPRHLESFAKLIEQNRKDYDYSTDGLVLSGPYLELPTDKRPKDVIAFKLNDEEGQSTVIREIVWKTSAFGVLVPKAVVDPIKFEGVTVRQAALHNAKWLMEMGAGVGAHVRVIRSGDIIPKIIAVDKKAKVTLPKGVWNKTRTHLMAEANVASQFTRCFKYIGLEHAGPGIAQTAFEVYETPVNFLKALAKNKEATVNRIASAGVAKRILSAFDMSKVQLPELMVATHIFGTGVGTTQLAKMQDLHKLVHNYVAGKPISRNDVEWNALGPVLGDKLRKSIPQFLTFAKNNPAWINKPVAKKSPTSSKLKGLCVSWTGYRSKEQEDWVHANGGQVVPFGSKTQVLIYKEGGKASSKVSKAAEKGIRTCHFEELV
jgi:NAD-dependent DNA ligase